MVQVCGIEPDIGCFCVEAKVYVAKVQGGKVQVGQSAGGLLLHSSVIRFVFAAPRFAGGHGKM